MRVFFALLVFFAASAFAQTRAQTIIPRVGFRDAIIVRVQQIDQGVRIESRDDLSFAIGPAQTLVSLDPAYQQYAAAPGTLGLVIEQVAREAIATARRAPRPQARLQPPRTTPPRQAPLPQIQPQERQAAPAPQAQPRQTQQARLPQPLEAEPLEVQQQQQPAADVRLASLIRSRASLAQLDPAPLSRPFLGDLVEILAIDGAPVTADRLEGLNLAADEAWTRARRNARAGRFAASPLERYGAVVHLTPGAGLLLDPGTCTPADQANRLFLMLSQNALATADRRTPGAEADFFRLLRDVTPTAYSTTPVTCRAGAWEIARPRR